MEPRQSPCTSVLILPAWRHGAIAGATVGGLASVVSDYPVDQPRCLEFVEFSDSDAEHVTTGVVNLPFVELVVINELQDEVPLLVAAAPGITVAVCVTIAVAISVGAVGGAVASTLLTDSVSVSGHEARALDLLIHTALKRVVEAGAFSCYVVDVADLGLDADRELVARIPRQAEAFRIIGDQSECHIFSFRWLWTRKSPALMAGLVVRCWLFRCGYLSASEGWYASGSSIIRQDSVFLRASVRMLSTRRVIGIFLRTRSW